jgi:hypothetical protein
VVGVSGDSKSGVGEGGGLFSRGTLKILHSTVSGNTVTGVADSEGGGVFSVGPFTAVNSTLNGNTAEAGSQAYLAGAGSARLLFSTVVGTVDAASIFVGRGKSVTIASTILTRPPGGANCAVDPDGQVTDGGHNLEYSDTSSNTCGLTDDAEAGDPLLGPLADNGGSTWTMALSPASPAVDNGDPDLCATLPPVGPDGFDQRGVRRGADGNGDRLEGCDIGAYELLPVG